MTSRLLHLPRTLPTWRGVATTASLVIFAATLLYGLVDFSKWLNLALSEYDPGPLSVIVGIVLTAAMVWAVSHAAWWLVERAWEKR